MADWKKASGCICSSPDFELGRVRRRTSCPKRTVAVPLKICLVNIKLSGGDDVGNIRISECDRVYKHALPIEVATLTR